MAAPNPPEKFAPYLLQAFAARILANQKQASVDLGELEKQGYDVETLTEMVRDYAVLPEAERQFHADVHGKVIHFARIPALGAPTQPLPSLAGAPVPAEPIPKSSPPPPGPLKRIVVRPVTPSTSAKPHSPGRL